LYKPGDEEFEDLIGVVVTPVTSETVLLTVGLGTVTKTFVPNRQHVIEAYLNTT